MNHPRLTPTVEAEIENVIDRLIGQAEQLVDDKLRETHTDLVLRATDDDCIIDFDVVDEAVELSRADFAAQCELLRPRMRADLRRFVIDGTRPGAIDTGR